MVDLTSAEKKFLAKLEESLDDLTEKLSSFKGMIYGESGVGKTVLAMQIARYLIKPGQTVLYIDSSQGWVVIKNHPNLLPNTKRLVITNVDMLEDVARAIKDKMGSFASIGAVVVDEHSSYAEADLLALTESRAAIEKGKDPDAPSWPDMNASSNRMKKATAPLLKLEDTHVILVAHERVDKDNVGVTVTSPMYLPKYGAHLRGLLHLVGHMTADEKSAPEGKVIYTRRIQVNPTRKVIAKTRIGGFESVEVTAKQLVVGIKEWLGGKRETVQEQEIKPDSNIPSEEPTDLPSDSGLAAEIEEVG
jgi:hypothetical protein